MVKDLFRKIRALRKKNNFSQKYMAKELEISRPTYAQIEQGERDLTITEAEKIASIFGISFDDLRCGRDSSIIVEIKEDKIMPKP